MIMSARLRTVVSVLTFCAVVLGVPQLSIGQCDPPGPNTKCWDNELGNGLWNADENWNPNERPQSSDNVYHLIAGTITYDVTDPFHETIASFTAGGTATGLVVNDGLELHVTGVMESNTSGDYELTLKTRGDMTVGGDVRFVNVTLDNGIAGDETTMNITGNVVKGNWYIPKDTTLTITGDVDAEGPKAWQIGEIIPGGPHVPGGVVHITGSTLGGSWEAFGDDPDANPLTGIHVEGTIEGGCWIVSATACPFEPPQSQLTFQHIMDGVDTCDRDGQTINLRWMGGESNLNALPGAVIEGGWWIFDDQRPSGEIAQISGGIWYQVHQSPAVTQFGPYVFHFGTINLDEFPGGPDCGLDPTHSDCSLRMDSTDIIISGPGTSSIPSLKLNPGGPGCSELPGGTIETADDDSHTDTLTIGILVMDPATSARAWINATSSGATETDIVIEESATVISSDINARSLTVDNPDPLEVALLELHSPGKNGCVINLAGPAEFGRTSRCEVVYHNQDNRFISRAEIVGDIASGGFTLHDRAVIRRAASKAGTSFDLRVAGHFDVQTGFRDSWDAGSIVADHWDTRTTDLTLSRIDPGRPDAAKLEIYSRDLGDISFTDTPCRGAMQDLTLQPGFYTSVELVNAHDNHGAACAETLYFRNIDVGVDATLEVDSFVLYYTAKLHAYGTVTQNGTPIPPEDLFTVLIKACSTIYGDFDCDGTIDQDDVDYFCAALGVPTVCSGPADGNCDGAVDEADAALMSANMGRTTPLCP